MGLSAYGPLIGGDNPAADDFIGNVVVVEAAVDGKVAEYLLYMTDGIVIGCVAVAEDCG